MPGPSVLRVGSPRLALVSGVLAALFAISPTLAASELEATSYQPDGWARYHARGWDGAKYVESSAWKGDGIYNTTGRYQTARYVVRGSTFLPGHYLIFQVMIENDGSTDRFRVGASGTADWNVKYFRGTTNITSAVVNGTYRTPYLGHGERLVLKVKVDGNFFTLDDLSRTRLLTITSVSDANRVDVVRVKARREVCSC